ncbi:MAG TPA: PilZ domain-containing protein [Vicinamibacteria bacterium]|nr:PilZ domain-containing protein [Vicinamibacteria bacterium]
MEERRKSPRALVDLPGRVTVGRETLECRVRDLCRDAALVLTAKCYPLQTATALELELPSTPGAVKVTGKVVRLAPQEQGGAQGMAILFDELPLETALRIELFVSDPDR